jgi:hypothetical protein
MRGRARLPTGHVRALRTCAVSVVAVLAGLWIGPGTVAAQSPDYGGYQTTSNWYGIDGYLRQSGTVYTTGDHAVWINLCGYNNCNEWVQLGTYQGIFRAGSSPGSVHIFYENEDPCGEYFADDVGAPPSANYPYYLNYNLQGGATYYCPGDPVPKTFYTFEYRKGSWGSTPFYWGVLDSTSGLAFAKTEVQNGAPIGTDRFGCDDQKQCGVHQGFGLHLYNGMYWYLWQTASSASHDDPPWVHTYYNYWTFATCPVSC